MVLLGKIGEVSDGCFNGCFSFDVLFWKGRCLANSIHSFPSKQGTQTTPKNKNQCLLHVLWWTSGVSWLDGTKLHLKRKGVPYPTLPWESLLCDFLSFFLLAADSSKILHFTSFHSITFHLMFSRWNLVRRGWQWIATHRLKDALFSSLLFLSFQSFSSLISHPLQELRIRYSCALSPPPRLALVRVGLGMIKSIN